MDITLVPETPFRFRVERQGPMRVPGVVFAMRELLPQAAGDKAREDQKQGQAAQVRLVGGPGERRASAGIRPRPTTIGLRSRLRGVDETLPPP
ncbi:hypothetical protein [Streptomyces sp. NPDC048825]|uniref:hypothetical protein n=1 Tax=Streptomyces sp. NPDC048825 TaxID=3365592 RepID=UPI00371BCE0B